MSDPMPDAVECVRPVPDPVRLAAPSRAAAPAWDGTGTLRLALVANGKPNSVELLDELAAQLGARGIPLEVRRYRKASVSVPPDAADVEEIARWAGAVIAALGD